MAGLSRSTIGLVFVSSNDYFVIEHCVYNVKSHVFAHSNNQSAAMTTGHLDQKKSFEVQKKRALSANRALIIKLIWASFYRNEAPLGISRVESFDKS